MSPQNTQLGLLLSRFHRHPARLASAVTLALAWGVLTLSACSHEAMTPDTSALTVSKDNPPAKCAEIGPVTGTTQGIGEGSEAALSDLKKEASKRSANYLKVGTYSGYGGSVNGTAYRCP